MHVTAADGTSLHCRVSGSGSPSLLLLHGWCGDSSQWDAQVRAFAPRHRVIRPDLRGHGRSEAPLDGYSLEQLTDDLVRSGRALRLRQAIVVAHALSGALALNLAVEQPRMVRGVVLIDWAFGEGRPRDEVLASPATQALAGPDYPAPLIEAFRTYFHRTASPRTVDRILSKVARTPQHVAMSTMVESSTVNSLAIAKRVEQPALYVCAARRRAPYQLREAMPRIEFSQVVGGGHFLHVEVPDQFNAMLQRFIQLV